MHMIFCLPSTVQPIHGSLTAVRRQPRRNREREAPVGKNKRTGLNFHMNFHGGDGRHETAGERQTNSGRDGRCLVSARVSWLRQWFTSFAESMSRSFTHDHYWCEDLTMRKSLPRRVALHRGPNWTSRLMFFGHTPID